MAAVHERLLGVSTGDDTRPDGRASTPETLRLRAATRALRLHLDELPIDYSDAVPPDRFLAGMAFMFARNRYACAESMIGAGFGGTVIGGAIARSILTEGLRWLWIAKDPASRRRCILGDLLEERSRVAAVLDTDASTMTRWLMPVPPVADLTGAPEAGSMQIACLVRTHCSTSSSPSSTRALHRRPTTILRPFSSRPRSCSTSQASGGAQPWCSPTPVTVTTSASAAP